MTIRNPFKQKETVDGKWSILDISACDQAGRLYNVEMEMAPAAVFPQRVLYYWAQLYGKQLREGEGYDELRPTISISFVNGVLFPEVGDHHLDFQLRSSRHADLIFSPYQSVHVIELPKFQRGPEELAEPLDAWCYFLKNGADLDPNALPTPLRQTTVPKAMEVLQMLKQTETEWLEYEARQRWERDERARLKEAQVKATEARREGRAEGRTEGDLVGRIQICEQLLNLAVTPAEDLFGLTAADLQAKAVSLAQQLAQRVKGKNGYPKVDMLFVEAFKP